jgi:hypothetical protein
MIPIWLVLHNEIKKEISGEERKTERSKEREK